MEADVKLSISDRQTVLFYIYLSHPADDDGHMNFNHYEP